MKKALEWVILLIINKIIESIVTTITNPTGVFEGTVGFERSFDSRGETPVVAGNSRVGVYAEGHVTADTITVAYYDHLTADRDSTLVYATALYQEPASTITGVIKDFNDNLIDGALCISITPTTVSIYMQ